MKPIMAVLALAFVATFIIVYSVLSNWTAEDYWGVGPAADVFVGAYCWVSGGDGVGC